MALTRQPSDLKSRVITCLNKLSDRDTLSLASSELESIARTLSNDNFAPFLTCLSTTDSSEKSPVRRQCVRLITVLSAAHGDALSPHISKLISAVLRRLRDPDSAVRSACVEAVSSISSYINKPPFSVIIKPLLDCIFHEQDQNAQISASLCLGAAVEATPEVDTVELKKLLPKLLKLAKNDCFKAKPALLSLIGSIVSTGSVSSKIALNNLVPCVVEFLSSEDWATRKAAAETLAKVAETEKDLLTEHKSPCLASLESKKFDKVKIVRETINRALELWKEIPQASNPQLQSKSSSKGSSSSEGSTVISYSVRDSGYETPRAKKLVASCSFPTSSKSISSTQRRGTLGSDNGKLNATKVEFKKSNDSKIEVESENGQKSPNISKSNGVLSENSCNSKLEARRVLFPKPSDEKSHTSNNSRFRSRVVPICEDESVEVDVVEGDSNATEEFGSQKEYGNFSLIRQQLIQIENQQYNLLELLQRFIGSSKNGMHSLEKRVNCLEKVLDEMSRDLGISTQRFPNSDSTGNSCRMLAGEEFLSPKFWSKAEGQCNNSMFTFSSKSQSMNTMHNISNNGTNSEITKFGSPQYQQPISGKTPPLINTSWEMRGTLESHTNRRL